MKYNKLVHLFAVALMLAVAIPAVASPKGAKMSNTLAKGQFAVAGGEIINGTTLAPGEYKVVANDSTVSFFRGGKLIVQAPIQWKDATLKTEQNAIVTEAGKVQEVRFKGQNRSVVVQ
ncbi:MAG: hypothetical protein WBE21_07460 [Candidatus Acidiferrales bacterium]|jgi:hypothetical protein|nr:hypothetical protein [Candidatus Acidoferrales bacterium]